MRRSGGFTGRAVHVRLDSEQLPPADAARLIELVSSVDLERLEPGGETPAGAGAPRYELSIERDGHRWQGAVSEPAVPPDLRPLLQFLTAAVH